MKIAFAYRNLNRSGSLERDTVHLVQGLVRRGVELHCYCDPGTSVDIDGVVRHDVVPLTRSRSRLGYPLLRGTFAHRATKALRADRKHYDLVHVLGVSAWENDVVHVPAVMAAEQARWPSRGGQGHRAAALRARLAPLVRPEVGVVRTIERLQFRPGRYLRVTAVTDQVRDDLVRCHGVPAERIAIIPPAVEAARFAQAKDGRLRSELAIEADAHVVLFVGHAFERKGLGDAISALATCSDPAHLVVVGGGDPALYRRMADELGVAGRIHFVGTVEKPEDYYAAADLLVLPTRSDPWGIPIIESMAAGIPVITTLAAGSASVAVEAGSGIVVPLRAPRELGEAMELLLGDSARRREMGERGRAGAARFDIEPIVDATLEIYELALAERRSA
jgi:UDP-glucose:(heptosyl)LPS alpha-1,3-glucosyltransferase